MSDEEVTFNIEPSTILSILKRAASKERTVVEFRAEEKDGEMQLSKALDITDHVEVLESDQEVNSGRN